MNRRERRAAASGLQPLPSGYVLTCKRMEDALRAWLAAYPDDRPRFALPDRSVFAIACVDHVIEGISHNEAARGLAERFCEIGCEIGGPNGQPTLVMLRAVLDSVGLPWDVVPIAELSAKWSIVSRGSRGGATS